MHCCHPAKAKLESSTNSSASPKSLYGGDGKISDSGPDSQNLDVQQRTSEDAENDRPMENDESTSHRDGFPKSIDGYHITGEADADADALGRLEKNQDDEIDLQNNKDESIQNHVAGCEEYGCGDDKMDDAEAGADAQAHEEKIVCDVDSAPDNFNDDFLLISKDIRPSISNPLCSVASPLNYETSLDEVVNLVTTMAKEMAGDCSTHDNEVPTYDFDVSELKWDPIKFEPFKKWLGTTTKRTRHTAKGDYMLLPSDQLRWADKDIMSQLMSARTWLQNFHIDALLNIVAIEFDMDHRVRDWGILDMQMTNLLIFKEFKIMSIEDYVNGQKLKNCGIPCDALKRVFGCGHFGKNHWV